MAESKRFKKSNNSDLAMKTEGTLIRTFNLESASNAYRGRLVYGGTTEGEVTVGSDEYLSCIGWLVNDETPAAQKEATRTATTFSADDEVAVASGDGYVLAYGEEAITIGAKLMCGTAGAVKNYDGHATDEPSGIVAKAEETITEAGDIVVRMLI